MWLKSYLNNSSQKVAIKEALSELDDLKAGAPQGSVLGHLLFLVFINDIADDMLGLSRLFADDTPIGHIALDESTLKNMIKGILPTSCVIFSYPKLLSISVLTFIK
jgi:hypothetical protein